MSNGSWDNSGAPAPKPGMPLWGKIALGCGVAMLLVLGACVVGGAYFVNKVKKDPEGFKKQVMGFAIDKMRPEWEDFRAVVEQLRTPEGCKALYSANPDLAKIWAKESDFLEEAKGWQKELESAPELSVDMLEGGHLQMNNRIGGSVYISWRPKKGPDVSVLFETSHAKAGGHRKILELKVR